MKYVAYYRVSTKKQSLGLEAQKTSVTNYINQDSANVLIAEYSERESGKNDYREELNKAIECCKKNNATLVIAKLDRLSRKVSFIFSLKDADINFIALDVPTFSTLTLGIYATLAQSEREMISMRTKNALAELKNNGVKLGNPNATFTNEMREKANERKHEIANNNINNKRAICVIKQMLSKTNNISDIARYLNENGFVTSRGNKFSCVQVKRLINRM